MNILKTPPVHRELNNSVSLSGITLLKDGKYSNRYVGLKKVQVSPNGQIVIEKPPISTHESKPKRKITKVKIDSTVHIENTEHSVNVHTGGNGHRFSIKKPVIRARILNYINQQKGTKELYFLTVTFPTCVTDDLAYKFFNQWLTVLRSKNIIRTYLWVAERQQNGTVHYHIAIPHRVYAPHANKAMQIILTNAVRKQQLQWNIQAAKKYNGVDLAKNRKTRRVTNFAVKKGQKSLANYLTKYVTKNDEKFSHYAWHCSREFSNLCLKISFTNDELLTCGFEQWINENKQFESEYFIFFPWHNRPPPQVMQHFADINFEILSRLQELN